MDEIWGVFCVDFQENWLRHNYIALYWVEGDVNKTAALILWESLPSQLTNTNGLSTGTMEQSVVRNR